MDRRLVDIVDWNKPLIYNEAGANYFETLSIEYFRNIFGEVKISDLVQKMNGNNFFEETIAVTIKEAIHYAK